METREPKKGQGVPKETRSHNSIAHLEHTLTAHFPRTDWFILRAELDGRGFFEAGMQAQVRMMAEVPAEMLGAKIGKSALITAFAASPAEKIRGVAALALPIVYPDDLKRQIEGVRTTAALEGTWPRELSNGVLHELIIQYGVAAVLPLVEKWIADPDPALRRVVAEAFRPRGVMLAHIAELKEAPSPLKDILVPLLDDPSDYVRKAVANNINDVSKDNPDAVLRWAREWMMSKASQERQWIIERGLRSLVDAGNPTALQLLGYTPASSLDVAWKDSLPPAVEINQLLPFEFDITNPTDGVAVVILLLFIDEPGKGRNRRTSKYQLWKGKIEAGGSKHVSKKIHFVDKNRQPKLPGICRLIATLNGESLEERELIFQRQA